MLTGCRCPRHCTNRKACPPSRATATWRWCTRRACGCSGAAPARPSMTCTSSTSRPTSGPPSPPPPPRTCPCPLPNRDLLLAMKQKPFYSTATDNTAAMGGSYACSSLMPACRPDARMLHVPVCASFSLSPGARFCHVAAVYQNSMYCFGGYDGTSRLNDFIEFRFGPGRPKALRLPSPHPSPSDLLTVSARPAAHPLLPGSCMWLQAWRRARSPRAPYWPTSRASSTARRSPTSPSWWRGKRSSRTRSSACAVPSFAHC